MTRSTKTLATGLTTIAPQCFAQHRNLDLILVNGVHRGYVWDGMASTAVPLGIDPPTAGPTLAVSSAGATYTYYAGYRRVDLSGNVPTYSCLSPLTTITTTAITGITFTWTNLQVDTQVRPDVVEFFRSTAGQSTTVYQIYATGFTATISATTNNGGYAQFAATSHGYNVGDVITTGITNYTQEQIVTGVESANSFTTNAGYVSTGSGTATQRVYQIADSGTITSSATSAGNVNFTMPAGHKLGVGAKFLVAGHSVAGYNTTHTVTALTATTVKTDIAYSADGTGGTWALTGLGSEDASDTELAAQPALPILNPDGSLNARRQVPPPKHMSSVQFFQDRAVYGVAREVLGAATTNASQTVTSSALNSDFVGRYLAAASESRLHKIVAVASATSMTIERAASSSTSQASCIIPHPSELAKIYFSEPDEPESVPPTNNVIIQDNTADADKNTALAPYGAALYVYQTRHLYKVTFARQPQIQADVRLVASRGCVNQRCWQQYEGSLYALDKDGVWRYDTSSGWEPLSPAIQDVFREGEVDWSKATWFWSVVHPEEETIRWFVAYTNSEAGNRPQHAICYHLRYKGWWTESYAHQLGGGCVVPISGRSRLVFGAQNEQIFVSGGTADGVASSATYTATGGTTSTATGTSLGSTINASIAFITGANQGLARRITANNGSTITFNPALDNSVAAGDVFAIGGIPYTLKTGLLSYPDSADVEKAEGAINRGMRIVYRPTTNAATLNVRVFNDHNTTASNNAIGVTQGNGITTTPGDPDTALDVKRSRSDKGDDPGTQWCSLGEGRLQPHERHNRFVGWQLNGVQTADQIVVYDIEVQGVK